MAVDLRSKLYLVIDDFADMRSMIRSMLVAYGVTRIDMAGNGKDAVKLLSKGNYDVVLCDYNLGDGKDGQQVLEEARDRGYIQYSTAFLMLTAENTMEMVMGAVEYLPDDYLSKPFNKDMLRSRLEKVIEGKGELADVVKLMKKGRHADALEMCDKKIKYNPRSATEMLKTKAEILMAMARYDEAGVLYEGVLAKRDVPWALIGLGKVRFYTRQYLEAKNIFQKVIAGNNTHMEAYDWLAKVTAALGDNKEALGILVAATDISPKSILRQMALGNLALKESDFAVAGKAFKKAVQVGCNSIYQTPTNYTQLAKIQGKSTGKSSTKDALATLSKLRSDYGKDNEASLHAAIAESLIMKNLGRESDAKKAFQEASTLFEAANNKISKELAMDMANTCIAYGDKDRGLGILRDLVKNHHEDKDVVAQVQDVFGAAGLADEGRELINAAIREVVELNNKGTQLAKEGRLEEAISLLEKAVETMPDNDTINLNIANVMMMHMKANGKSDTYMYKVRLYLEHVRNSDPGNDKLEKLNAMYEKLLAA